MSDLERYGLTPEIEAQFALVAGGRRHLARVISVHYGGLFARLEGRTVLAMPAGKVRRAMKEDVSYRIVVGDWVALEEPPGEGTFGVVVLLPRRTVLARKAAGEAPISQIMCSNVDVVFVVLSLHHDFNVRRLERYLAVATEGGAQAVVLLTKSDLADDLPARLKEAKAVAPGIRVHCASNTTSEGLAAIDAELETRKSYVLVGSSGVGKSTLVNRWVGSLASGVGETRASDGKGRHTTTHRELFVTDGGAILIDTPGMREVGLLASEFDVQEAFPDVAELARSCRFADCLHATEPDCGIRAAITEGRLDAARFVSYTKLVEEKRVQTAEAQAKAPRYVRGARPPRNR